MAPTPKKRHWSDTVKRGLAHGYKSGLEETNGEHLKAHGVAAKYESVKIKYVVPASVHTYTPDWPLPNGIIVETKGVFDAKDRAKHLLVKMMYPDLDIRFVFSSSRAKIAPGSPTTVAEWCRKHGYLYADKLIPVEWMREPGPKRKPAEVLASPAQVYGDILNLKTRRKPA